MDKPPSSPRPWEADFEGALQRGDVLGAATALRSAGTRGHVSASLLRAAAVIVERMRPAPMVRRDWAQRLLASLAGDVRAPVRRAANAAAREVEGSGD